MLLTETRKFDIQTFSFRTKRRSSSTIQLQRDFSKGSLMDFDTVYQFGKMVDLLTIEIENVNLDALDKLEAEGLPIYPSAKNLYV